MPGINEAKDATWDDIFNFQCTALHSSKRNEKSYILSEEMFSDGILYDQEDWGRWGHFGGNGFKFRMKEPDKNYIIYLKLQINPAYVPMTLETFHKNMIRSRIAIKTPDPVIALHSSDFTTSGEISFRLHPAGIEKIVFENDARDIGLGYIAMAIVKDDDLAARLGIMEKLLTNQ